MPVTEINKRLQEQQQQQQQAGNNDDLHSTNSLIDSITTQQQQQQLFNKLQQLQQQKDKNFVSDDESHKSTDNSSFYATNLHDKNSTRTHQQFTTDDDNEGPYPIAKQHNTSCPIVSAKAAAAASSSSNQTPSTASPPDSSVDLPLHNKLSINHQTKKRYSVDYFDQYKATTDDINRIPTFNSIYLQPNAQFIGEQQSGKSSFHIKVEFKTVDLFNSVVTGFLQISGLTDANSEITTYFKGEIINNPLHTYKWKNESGPNGTYEEPTVQKYSFITENKQWGSFAKNDFEHWKKLTQSTTFLSDDKLIKRLEKVQRGEEDNQYIYMRWKEEFLLPDSRIKQITGASFEGFYYIVLNIGGYNNSSNKKYNGLLPGGISGLYYHKSSEKFQSLSLRHVENHVDTGAFDFV
ncbi:Glucose-induced degradation protein 4 [Candida viswanathii]|uniref:Glucose-induced degradation protein 4 n=1 Tax=Candida viswanathii TaxID=5486 RepID=A0A367YFV8_9ASCO|nr:Glucose-induced degradation protein 4 [Candida viswanathii]